MNFVGLLHGGPTIMAEGTPAQKERHIGPIIRGEQVWCQGFSEPGAGSDLASLKTRAVRDGDHYVVNGHKIWTSFAQVADYCELLVRTDARRRSTAASPGSRCRWTSPGIEIRPLPTLLGSGEFSEVFLENVRVPVECRVGAENDGWRVTNVTLSFERGTAFASDMVKLQEALRELTAVARRDHARRRRGVGGPRAAPRDRSPGRRGRRALGAGEVHGERGRQDRACPA